MHWRTLTSAESFDELLSKEDTVFAVFKHSTRCSISHSAYGRMERDWVSVHPNIPVYLVDLLEYRQLSQWIAEKSGILHESPQLIIFNKGKAIAHWSHFDIRPSSNQW